VRNKLAWPYRGEVNTTNNFEEISVLQFISKAALAVAFTLSLVASSQAGFVITLEEIGPSILKVTGSGSFDLTGLNQYSNNTAQPNYLRFYQIEGGTGSADGFQIFTISGPANPLAFGPDVLTSIASTGQAFGFTNNGGWKISTPAGYVSGAQIDGSSTFTSNLVTLNYASYGMTAGQSRVFTYGPNNQTITITAVPEPGSLAVVGGLVAGMTVLVRRRRQS
jgi:hypothetical protein